MDSCMFRRKALKAEHFSQFKLREKRYEQQFSSIYIARLTALKDHVLQKANTKWGECRIVPLSDLAEQSPDDTCIIAGTLYRHQELKPSVLKELSDELQLVPQPARSNYASIKDVLFLEDKELRVKLVLNNSKLQCIVTGIVCAVLGRALENGTFLVIDFCFPGCPVKLVNKHLNHDEKVLFISGLDISNTPESLSLNLLSEWIQGMIGNSESQKEQASVVCVIIAGNSLRGTLEVHNHKSYFETKAHTEILIKEVALSAHRFDKYLYPIVQTCSVILMPGEFDPVCHTMPQQAFHPCTLPCSARFASLYGATNPWIARINSRVIAGSSGQPIHDLMKVAGLANQSPLEWLEQTLEWGHFAPTAPDTLSTYSYFNTDPFVMTECPDIYFAGNMEKYESKLYKGDEGQTVRLICIPSFSKTHMGVLVNLSDLRTWPISFGET